MSSSRSTGFDELAPRYDALRLADDALREELFATVARVGALRGRRVLDVGCGTGRFARWLVEHELAKVWGIDASPGMVEVARSKGVTVKEARAEQLPFKDGWFERATMLLVAHHVDRPRAFAEVARVLGAGGRFAVSTFAPEQFESHWLGRWFPSIERIDRERFGTPDALVGELQAAGFGDIAVERLDQQTRITRDVALERIRRKHISTFQLVSEEEYADGVARAERETPETVDVKQCWLVVAGDLSAGAGRTS